MKHKNKLIAQIFCIFMLCNISCGVSAEVVEEHRNGELVFYGHHEFYPDWVAAHEACKVIAEGHGYTQGQACRTRYADHNLARSFFAGTFNGKKGEKTGVYRSYFLYYPKYFIDTEESTPEKCGVGNPIEISTGAKKQSFTDINHRGITFERSYRSNRILPGSHIGKLWRHNFDTHMNYRASSGFQMNRILKNYLAQPRDTREFDTSHLPPGAVIRGEPSGACNHKFNQIRATYQGGRFQNDSWISEIVDDRLCVLTSNHGPHKGEVIARFNVLPTTRSAGTKLLQARSTQVITRPNGRVYTFMSVDGADYEEVNGIAVHLRVSSIGDDQYWKFTDTDGSVDTYSEGALIKRRFANGLEVDIVRDSDENDAGRMRAITQAGKEIMRFTYTDELTSSDSGDTNDSDEPIPELHIAQISYANKVITYNYDDNHNLISVSQDGKILETYHYEDPQAPHALTGITDAKNVRFATWTYSNGLAVSSEHAGGKEKETLDYSQANDPTNPSVTVTNSLGKKTTYHYKYINNRKRTVRVEGHVSTHCAAASQYKTYTGKGGLQTTTDWEGNVTYYEHDSKNRVTLKRQGYRWADGEPHWGYVNLDNVSSELVAPENPNTLIETKTCWNDVHSKPARIISADRVVIYDYLPSGRIANQKNVKRTAENAVCR